MKSNWREWRAHVAGLGLACAWLWLAGPLSAATLAYWRFEEGPAGALVYNNPTRYSVDTSGNGHHGNSFSLQNSASYSDAVPGLTIPQTGAPNRFSLYTGPGGPVRDLYTTTSLNQASLSSFTIEASVMFDGLGTWQTFVGRDANFSPLAALYFQMVQDSGRQNHVGCKIMDSGNVFRSVFSQAPVQPGRWYHFAAVANATNRTLTLLRYDETQGTYVVEGSTTWMGPMASQGGSWTLGRGMYNGNPTDSFNGRLDEVRISDTALSIPELLWSWAAPRAVSILAQPADVTVAEGGTAVFTVQCGGQPPWNVQWYRNGLPLSGAQQTTLAFGPVGVEDHLAQFHVVAANVVSGLTYSVTSRVALLSVAADATPPALLEAQWFGQPNQVTLLFSEPLEPASATNAAHYTLDGAAQVLAARLAAGGRAVVLETTPLAPGLACTVTVNGVRDQSAARNLIAAGAQATFIPGHQPLAREGRPWQEPSVDEPLGPSSRRTSWVISEIHYHPPGRADGRNAEFIEIFNSNPWPEDLSGYYLSGAVDYTFPSNTIVPALGFVVVAAVPADVQAIYGITGVYGPWGLGQSLPNDRGTLRLHHRQGAVMWETEYEDSDPWPVAADGGGHSLVLRRPSYGERDARAWGASRAPGGSPGAAEPALPSLGGLAWVRVNELLANAPTGEVDFVELFNYSTQAVDLAGCVLTDNPETNKYVFPPGSLVPPQNFLVVNQTTLGFGLKTGGDTLWLKAPDGALVLEAVRFGAQEQGVTWGRYPDGAPDFSRLTASSPGLPNAPSRLSEVVINEIMFNPISRNPDDEFIELYNRISQPVDLSGWQLRGGISYLIPSHVILPPYGHLVIARNAARLRGLHPGLSPNLILGDFSGQLSNQGERLQLARPVPSVSVETGVPVTNTLMVVVDELIYRDGGRWGRWADGGGSSLELVDARADKRLAPAWTDSDESATSGWATIETTGLLDHGNGPADSLQILLLGPGECLVDNVEVIPAGGGNLVRNPDFESGLDGWYAQGAFKYTYLETTQGYQSARSLHVVASDRGDTGANRIRTRLTAALSPGQTATLRARVKWLRGEPQILLRLRGNWLEAVGNALTTTAMGTPGRPNSQARPNAGPAITGVNHWPVLPASQETVTVAAQVSDADPLAYVFLHYRLDPSTNWSVLPMKYRGAGCYAAEIPGQAAGTLAAFYITAGDAGEPPAVSRFPAEIARECLVRWGEPEQAGALGVYRLWFTRATLEEWVRREKLSNDPLDATFAYGRHRVIYNAGAQFSGSPWHSQFYDSPLGNWCNYALFMPSDDRLLGATDFRIFFPGNDADDATALREQFGLWLCELLGLPFNHHRYVHFFVNGQRRGTILEDAQTPDPDLMESFWPETGGDGELYKVTMWHEFEDNAATYVTTQATLQNFTTTGGAKKLARYRWIFSQRGNPESAVAYTNLFALVDAANFPLSVVESRFSMLADADKWMRLFAFEHAVGNWDSWGNNNGQNVFLTRPEGQPWILLPVDADILLGSAPSDPPTSDLFRSSDPVLAGLYTVPVYRRAYWRALLELANGPFLPANADAWLDPRYAALQTNGAPVSSPQPIKNYLAARRNQILTQAAAEAGSVFAVTTPTNLLSQTNLLTISGTAPIEVERLLVNGIPWPVTWTTVSNWTLRVALTQGVQTLQVQGVDRWGNPRPGASALVTVEYQAAPESPVGKILFNEIMYQPAWSGAEYVELYNASSSSGFDLSGWRINGLDYTFPPGAWIAPGAYVVVTKDLHAYWNAYGINAPAVGQFAGNLQGDGETLTLLKPGLPPAPDLIVDRVRYSPLPPWPAGAAGQGAALQLMDPSQDNSRPGNWSDNTPLWRFFSYTGNLGSVNRFSRLSLYFDNGGEVLLDDLALVVGDTPEAGTNYVANAGFESPLAPTWMVSPSGLATNSYLTNGMAHTGAASLRFHNAVGSGSVSHFYQTLTNVIAGGLPPNTVGTLSFWYRSDGRGTLNLYVNAGFRVTLPLGSGSGSTARLTPGLSNSVFAALPALPPIYLNEVQAENRSGPVDRMGEREPWIEIYNAGTEPVNLAQCWLSEDPEHLKRWSFPTGAVLQPGEFRLVWADGEAGESTAGEWHTNFRLSPTSGVVVLTLVASNATVVLDELRYDRLAPDRSHGAWPDGQLFYRQTFHYPSPGAPNDAREPLPVLFINEWMAANNRTVADPADGDFEDWFELHNPGDSPVNLAGYYLTDNLANPRQYRIPDGFVIPARGFLLVWADNETGQNALGAGLHVNFALRQAGEAIGLFAPDGITALDTLTFGPQTNDVSQGRLPDGAATLAFFNYPTPGLPNRLAPPALAPRLFALQWQNSGQFRFAFQLPAPVNYLIEYTEDLRAAQWTPLRPAQIGSGTVEVVDDTTGRPRRFYRVLLNP
ncbi:lamin tail domain-containing protein [Fontisphaera persica]|uniref:lamin tail domain-containing protein n=1 Tax=Fontisphaera persica TaxID=2974023 RepID=UPI0024BFB292|nr:lamin tail domain-containing protein [Fontisphaera persica]WCJ58246.1 lamin tail domain-containing protein [Fontisphaera persica]